MKRVSTLFKSTADRMVDRLVGKATATAGCPYESWYECVYNPAICTGGHVKYSYYVRSNCTVSGPNYAGCC